MNVLINMLNHSKAGQRSLEDVVGIFGHQLRALGHKVIWSEANDRFLLQNFDCEVEFNGRRDHFDHRDGNYNLIVEGFTPEVTSVIAEYHAMGARFICLATEEPTTKGFNHGVHREMRERQEEFGHAAKYFDAILYLVPGAYVANWYGQHAPSAYVELGYAPTLVRQQFVREPEYDFAFFGSLTKRRYAILKKLARRAGTKNAVRIVADFPEQAERDRIIQNAKVLVQLRKFDEMGLVSSSRCNTSLCCGRPVVAEPHDVELSRVWTEVVSFSKTEAGFYDLAMLTLRRWRDAHAGQFDRFRTRLTPEVCVGEALRAVGLTVPSERLVA